MDDPFFCPDCRELHHEPAEAVLGHLVRCLACATGDETTRELTVREIAVLLVPPPMKTAA
jgi:hypothetical protein